MDIRTDLLNVLGLSTFIVVDLETTGLEPETDRIIEIGAIKFSKGEEAETFETLVDPQRPIPDFITRLTGITDDDVVKAPKISEVFTKLGAFIGDAPIVGHQVNFDASFLEYHFRIMHNDFESWEDRVKRFKYVDNLRLDTLFLSRILMPFLPRHKLASVAGAFGIDLESAHRAIEDARATGLVFLNLVDRALATKPDALKNIINLLFSNSKRAKTFFVPVLKFKTERHIDATGTALVDDARNAQEFYNVIGESEYHLDPDTEDDAFEEVDNAAIEAYFDDGGKLSSVIPGHEMRPPQKQMAYMVSDALNSSSFVVTEAGTGTGKSMAYLIPAIEWALKNRNKGQRVVISTNTKNLQEQLFFKDLPTVYSARRGRFKAALIKGRSNYLCLDKWHTLMTDMNQRLSQDERTRILPLVLWVEQTRTGDIAENSGFQLENNLGLWLKLIAEPSYCPGRSCTYYKDCFLMKAREHARKSDIVIVNHALLFSDLAARHSILGQYDNLIIDEAHNIEKTAAEYLGTRVSYWSFRNIYHKLYEDEPRKNGTILQLEYRMSRVTLKDDVQSNLFQAINPVKKNSLHLKQLVSLFYREFNAAVKAKYVKKENPANDEYRVRYFKNFKFFKEFSETIADIDRTLISLEKSVEQLIDELFNLNKGLFDFQDQILRELTAIQQDTSELREAFRFCLDAEEEHYVYWLDIPRSERNIDIPLSAVPLKIAELLKLQLFEQLNAAVFSSATLAVDKKFDYFKNRIGLDLLTDKAVYSEILGSTFNYDEQLKMMVADFVSDPRNPEFAQDLMDLLKDIHTAHKRGMLVLFTNYNLLNMAYQELKPYFDSERILLLAQGKSGSRNNIINQFRENRDSILFGTDSFWEGIDVPGDALEILFIPKLPFDVPSEPVIAARMEEIKKYGGNPFFEYAVPEAIIKFRQGFGRLIRKRSDHGVVIVADNRLSRMQYGRQFLNSLPVNADIYHKKEDLLEDLEEWFFLQKPERAEQATEES